MSNTLITNLDNSKEVYIVNILLFFLADIFITHKKNNQHSLIEIFQTVRVENYIRLFRV